MINDDKKAVIFCKIKHKQNQDINDFIINDKEKN